MFLFITKQHRDQKVWGSIPNPGDGLGPWASSLNLSRLPFCVTARITCVSIYIQNAKVSSIKDKFFHPSKECHTSNQLSMQLITTKHEEKCLLSEIESIAVIKHPNDKGRLHYHDFIIKTSILKCWGLMIRVFNFKGSLFLFELCANILNFHIISCPKKNICPSDSKIIIRSSL